MKILSDQTLEQRARRRLAKYGLRIRKSREQGGGYTVYNDPQEVGLYPEGGEAWFSTLFKLLEYTDRLHEQYET